MHEHRRNNDADDLTGRRLEAIAESKYAKLIASIGVPILISVLGVYMVADRSSSKEVTVRMETAQAEQGKDIAQIKSDVRDVNTRLDEGVIRQVDSQGKHLDNIEQRVQVIERVIKTP